MTLTRQLSIEHLAISSLVDDRNNARTHSDKHIGFSAVSIGHFGSYAPIFVDQGNQVLAGSGRFGAARKLGLDELPVTRASDLSDADSRALALADNNIAELAAWDDAAVQR